jgi:hypothetical protein
MLYWCFMSALKNQHLLLQFLKDLSMKFNNATKSIAIVGATTVFSSLCAGGALAQSSKFAATYDTDEVMVEVEVDGGDGICQDANDITTCTAIAGPVAEAELASLHVANWKELLLGLSGQVNLVTFTQAKGKNDGGKVTSIAEGTVRAGVLVLPEGSSNANASTCARAFAANDNGANVFAAPGPVTFASRRQALSVKVALDVVGSIPDVCDAQCIEDNLGIEGDVTVALELDTTAAHHFNFVADDLTSGRYDILGCYDLSALAEVSGADIDADTAASSKVVLGPRIITVQEVRATKDGIIDESNSGS